MIQIERDIISGFILDKYVGFHEFVIFNHEVFAAFNKNDLFYKSIIMHSLSMVQFIIKEISIIEDPISDKLSHLMAINISQNGSHGPRIN